MTPVLRPRVIGKDTFLAGNPHCADAYQRKIAKHMDTYGPNVVPLVFGLSGQLATDSARWLATVVSADFRPQLRFFKLHLVSWAQGP